MGNLCAADRANLLRSYSNDGSDVAGLKSLLGKRCGQNDSIVFVNHGGNLLGWIGGDQSWLVCSAGFFLKVIRAHDLLAILFLGYLLKVLAVNLFKLLDSYRRVAVKHGVTVGANWN